LVSTEREIASTPPVELREHDEKLTIVEALVGVNPKDI
jgi:HSP20 family molecular chaperone IbpA